MISQRHRTTAVLSFATDVAATFLAFFLAWVLRFETLLIPWLEHGSKPDFIPYLQLLPFIVLAWPTVFFFQGLYQSKLGKSRIEQSVSILIAVLFAGLLLTFLTAWYRPALVDQPGEIFTYSRAFLAIFLVTNFVFTAAGRFTLQAFMRNLRRRGRGLRRILVVGSGRLGREVTEKILAHRSLGFEVVGFLDDNPGSRFILGRPVLGSLKSLPEVLEEHQIDQVMIALPLEAYRKTMRILEHLYKECVEVRLVPDVLQYAALKATIEDLDGTPLINLSQVPLEGWTSLVKRTIDLLLSAAAMLLTLPLLPIVALAIWLEDRGPIFYRQERMGLDGRSFQILKLRSMRINAETSTGPIWAVKNDPRRTRVGALLRRTSIDELPQLWNVLKGEMSLVGPRPERPAFVREFKHKVPQYMQRHRVRAGITGWAQVHGWRGNTSIRRRIQYDIYYIENWSLMLDFKILWMTLRNPRIQQNAN